MPIFSIKDSKLRNRHPERKIRTLTIVLTDDCNLRCLYCYEKHEMREKRVIPFDLAIEAISEYLNMEDTFDGVIVDFFGGEPLLQYELLKNIVEWCKVRTWKKDYHFMLSTNGTLLNEEKKEWFAENKKILTLSLSIDGNRTAHNITRNNSYDLISPHIDFVMKHWPFQPFKMTVTADTIPYVADSIIEMEERGLYFTANVVFEDIWGTPGNKEQLLKIYQTQLDRLVDYYIENSHLYPVSPMLSVLPTYLGIPGLNMVDNSECIRYCGAGHEMVVVDTDGKKYPCHRFIPWILGKEFPITPINQQTRWKPEECNECKIVQSCPTCAGYNWEINNDSAVRTTYHCESHKMEVMAAAKIAAYRLKKTPLSQFDSLPPDEKDFIYKKVNTLIELMENGI